MNVSVHDDANAWAAHERRRSDFAGQRRGCTPPDWYCIVYVLRVNWINKKLNIIENIYYTTLFG